MNLNKVQLIGRITSDLELKQTKNGQDVCSFSIATNRVWKDKQGEKQEQTEFHNIVVWAQQAKTITTYASKGQEMYIEGRNETRNWEDESTGKKMYRTEVIVDKFEFGTKPKGFTPGEAKGEVEETESEEINPDDIPF